MKVPNITPTGLNITQNLNKGRIYLFNDAIDIVKKFPVPATMSNNGLRIDVPKDSNNIKHIIEKFNETGIKFDIIA